MGHISKSMLAGSIGPASSAAMAGGIGNEDVLLCLFFGAGAVVVLSQIIPCLMLYGALLKAVSQIIAEQRQLKRI